jgi:hypothetical protein
MDPQAGLCFRLGAIRVVGQLSLDLVAAFPPFAIGLGRR